MSLSVEPKIPRADRSAETASAVGATPGPDRGSVRMKAVADLFAKPAVYGSLIPAVALMNALTGMVLPTLMVPRVFGEYALVVTLFQYGLIFDLGISQLIDRWIPALLGRQRLADAERFGQHLLWLRIYVGFAAYGGAAAVLVGLAAVHRLPFTLEAGLLSGLAGVLYMVALGPACLHRARSERGHYAIAVSVLSVGLVFARLGGLYVGGVIGCFAALALWYFCFSVVFHRANPPRFNERPGAGEAASVIAQGIPFFATSLIWAFYITANRWFASPLIEPVSFGQFAFSANIFALLVGSGGAFSAFYYPRIVSRLARGGRFSLSHELFLDWSKLAIAVGLIVAIGIALSGILIPFIYPIYAHAVPTARVLLIAVPAMVLASWLMPVLLSAGRRPWLDGILIYPMATAILVIGIRIMFLRWDVIGIAAASTLSALALVAMQLVSLRSTRILRMRDAGALFGITLFVTAALCGLSWAMS